MSRLIELLDRIREHTPRPAGFRSSDKNHGEFGLIAQLTPEALTDDPKLVNSGADAFLLQIGSLDHPDLPASADTLKGEIWGVRLPLFTLAETKELIRLGCDYVIFDAAGTEAGLLTLQDLGIVITVDHRSDEGMIRTLGELSINGLLFRPAIQESPLSFHTLANIQRVCGVIDRPLLIELPEGIGAADLEVLRSVETTGLINNVPPASQPAKIQNLMTRLPPRSEGRMIRRAVPFSFSDEFL